MARLMPFDELNTLRQKLTTPSKPPKEEDIIDEILDILLVSYLNGVNDVNESMNANISPDLDQVDDAINKIIAGESFVDRVNRYATEGAWESIQKVADTESHRVYNQAVMDAAKRAKATTKTWKTMMDDRVRDTHDWLEGTTVGIDEYFYSYTGDRGMFPGDFNDPSENVNCRCYLSVK